MIEPLDYPRSISIDEAAALLGCSEHQIRQLIRERRVGFTKGKRSSFRFFPEHLEQIKDALEVKPIRTPTEEIESLAVRLSRTGKRKRRPKKPSQPRRSSNDEVL